MQGIFSFKIRFLATIFLILFYIFGWVIFSNAKLGTLSEYNFMASTYIAYAIGGVFALLASLKIAISNSLGKFLLFSGIGLSLVSLGFMVFDFYSYVIKEPTFPSSADTFFLLSTFFIPISYFYLLKTYQMQIKTRVAVYGILVFLISLISMLWIQGALLNSLSLSDYGKSLYVIFYSISDSIIIASAFITMAVAGGKIISGLSFYVSGLVLYALGAISFFIRDLNNSYYFGDISDLFYLLAGVIMSIGVITIANRLYISKN